MTAYLINETVLRQVLDALCGDIAYMENLSPVQPYVETSKAISALRAILSAPPSEPVAWRTVGGNQLTNYYVYNEMGNGEPLYRKDTP